MICIQEWELCGLCPVLYFQLHHLPGNGVKGLWENTGGKNNYAINWMCYWNGCNFFPSALLVFFFFPIWNNLKKYAAVYRSLEGINAAVVGIMIASTFYIMKDISLFDVKRKFDQR